MHMDGPVIDPAAIISILSFPLVTSATSHQVQIIETMIKHVILSVWQVCVCQRLSLTLPVD